MTLGTLGRRWHQASLRTRILAATAGLAAVALLLAVVAFGFTLDRILYESAMTTATAQADQVADRLLHETGSEQHILDEVPTHGSLIQVVDATDQVVAATERSLDHTPAVDLQAQPGKVITRQVAGVPGDEHDPYAVVVQGLTKPTARGGTVLLVASPLRGETTLVKGATAALAVLALGLLAGLLWLIDRVLRSALGRVDDIRSSVDTITATGQEARVPVPPGGDEITRLATTMNSMLDRLSASDAAQRAFVSNASHELRSPLTTIRMIAEISPQGVDAENTQVLSTETARMQQLVDDLLTLAKADDRGLALEARDVDLDDLVLQEARRVRAVTRLAVEVDVVAVRTTGDPRRLAQVAHNLVDNAMRHARSAVRLRCAVEDGRAVLDIDNDGDVVPLELREQIFERFSRLQQSRDRDTGGSGLGLAIVRALVEAHDGTVVVTETPDGWCRFRVSLPADIPEPEPDWDDDLDAPNSGSTYRCG